MTAQSTLERTDEQFAEIITAIRDSANARVAAAAAGRKVPEAYRLPYGVSADSSQELPSDAKEALNEQRDFNLALIDTNKSEVAEHAQQRSKNQITGQSFEERIRARQKKNSEEFEKNNKAIADKVIAAGQGRSEEEKNLIAAAYEAACDFLFKQVWQRIVDFFMELAKRLKELVDKIAQWFKDRWNDVKNWWKRNIG